MKTLPEVFIYLAIMVISMQFAAARDVTERKQAELALKKASLYTRSLIEASLDPLVTISREGKITDVNEATEKVTGVPRQRLIGTDFSDYFTQPEMARSGYRQVFADGSVTDYPLALRHASGKLTEVLYNASVFKSEAGEVEGVFAAARDVTERKRAEDEVRKLNEGKV
jgi:PAS domain S-box-containing protein